jgi:hypothetical protein
MREGPLRVLVGKERFSENHAWSEMPQHWPAGLAGQVVIEAVGQGQLEARLAGGGSPVNVVVPLWSPLPGRAIRDGSFGLIPQADPSRPSRVCTPSIASSTASPTSTRSSSRPVIRPGSHPSSTTPCWPSCAPAPGSSTSPAAPYPADGPLASHPRIVATAHTAALTSDYFAAASRRLGDGLANYLDHQPPAGLLR